MTSVLKRDTLNYLAGALVSLALAASFLYTVHVFYGLPGLDTDLEKYLKQCSDITCRIGKVTAIGTIVLLSTSTIFFGVLGLACFTVVLISKLLP